MSHAYYNEIDPYAAAWLRNLIAAGHIAPGDVDERSIRDVQSSDLIGYTQCHFFAGIGVWSYALRRAGWDDSRPVWTGSCPCQPFSAAGTKGGFADDRHLWPEFFRLIRAHSPHAVFGEQVASKDGLAWLDTVQADLEGADYAFGALDLCAAGFGAPHIRQRLFFVADDSDLGHDWRWSSEASNGRGPARIEPQRLRHACELVGHADDAGSQGRIERRDCADQLPVRPASMASVRLGDATDESRERNTGEVSTAQEGFDGSRLAVDGSLSVGSEHAGAGLGAGFWSNADWLPCIDGKARPVEPGTFPLAHGVAGRVGRLRAYGNAIVAEVAAEFIGAYLDHRRAT